jgi:hypothetical protein
MNGDQTLKAFAQGTYVDTKVTEACSLTIKPQDMNVRYDADGGGSQSIQGMLRVLAVSALTASTGMGHLYLEYDMEFMSPTLASAVSEPIEGIFTMTFTTFAATEENLLVCTCKVPAAGNATALFNAVPGNDGYIYVLKVETNTDPGDCPIVSAQNEEGMLFGGIGDEIFMRTLGWGSNDFTNGTVACVFFTTLETAQAFVSINADAVSDGQLYISTTNGSCTSTIGFTYLGVPIV